MEFRKFENKFFLRIDKGEEIISTILSFCKDNKIKLGSVYGIGATNKFTIGAFKTKEKEYVSKEYEGDYEIAPLVGNITSMNSEPYLHVHANLAGIDNHSFGGHLNSAFVSATFECVIDVFNGEVGREFSEEIGLNLISF